MRRALASTLVAFVAAGSLSACGDDSEPDTLPSSSTTRPPTVSAPSSGSTTTTAAVTDDAPDLSAVQVKLTTIAEGLDRPVAFATRSGDTALYVAEQHAARVRAIRDGALVDAPVLDLGGEVTDGGEQGLLGIAFSADGDTLYVDFTDTNGDTRIQAFTMDGDIAAKASRRELMLIDQPYPNHNGGEIAIGPDGTLYIALGDGGAGGDPEGNAQNLASPLGKILRIDPTAGGGGEYQVPADNPFVDDADARPEIWHYGLRNPWRFSFDSVTGEMWIGDVGQGEWEEVDIAAPAAKGVNFGWDGLYRGDKVIGVFTWYALVRFVDQAEFQYEGSVTVVR